MTTHPSSQQKREQEVPAQLPSESMVGRVNELAEALIMLKESAETGGLPDMHIENILKWYRVTVEKEIAEASKEITRFEVIDHRQCSSCKGRLTADYLQKDGTYKEEPCGVCYGSGTRGGRVFSAWDCEIEQSVQDDGRTLKIFVNDRTKPALNTEGME